MSRPIGGKDGKPTCLFLYEKERQMADILMRSGNHDSVSSMVRKWIREEFKDNFPNGKVEHLQRAMTELQTQQKELSEQLHTIEKDMQTERVKASKAIEIYRKRQKSLNKENYERQQIAWITANVDLLEPSFPGMTAEEIYSNLEESNKKMVR